MRLYNPSKGIDEELCSLSLILGLFRHVASGRKLENRLDGSFRRIHFERSCLPASLSDMCF